jgi:anaerobic selenocysteine-containing dehydrogenase
MRLNRAINRIVGGKTYAKWFVIISPKDVTALGWRAGQELEETTEGGKLTLRAVRKRGRRTPIEE